MQTRDSCWSEAYPGLMQSEASPIRTPLLFQFLKCQGDEIVRRRVWPYQAGRPRDLALQGMDKERRISAIDARFTPRFPRIMRRSTPGDKASVCVIRLSATVIAFVSNNEPIGYRGHRGPYLARYRCFQPYVQLKYCESLSR